MIVVSDYYDEDDRDDHGATIGMCFAALSGGIMGFFIGFLTAFWIC